MPKTSGFDLFKQRFDAPPAIVVEWTDDRTLPGHNASARGWLCIDSLRGGAAGGGTRMRPGGTREEAVFLAKTMHVKFRVCGPDIGGGKSVIDFAPRTPHEKRGVLERWYAHVGPYLQACYGTGGDVGVDEVLDATPAIEATTGLEHPQAGIIIGHYQDGEVDGESRKKKVARMRKGVEAPLALPGCKGPHKGKWLVADVATGAGVVRAIETYATVRSIDLRGQRAIIEGFGAVGAFAAYYLDRLGVKIVGATTFDPSSRSFRIASDPAGLSVHALIEAAFANRRQLPPAGHKVYSKSATIKDASTGDALMAIPADIFIPAGASHTITAKRLATLAKSGVKLWSCGANNPFFDGKPGTPYVKRVANMLELMRAADPKFSIIPDFVANSGMARTFAYMMTEGAKPDAPSILADLRGRMDDAVEKLVEGHRSPTGLIERGYEAFLA